MKNLTVSEVRNYLNGKRVFVVDAAKSASIQRLAMAVGYLWGMDPMDVVKHLDKPYLFFTIKENGAWIKSTLDYEKFQKSSKTLITVDDLLSIRIKDNGHYVTPETYLKNHNAEIKLACEERSISEAVREGRMTQAEGKLAMDKLHGVTTTAATATATATVSADAATRRLYAQAYEKGYADALAGKTYNPVMG